jgi:hypothetical protein
MSEQQGPHGTAAPASGGQRQQAKPYIPPKVVDYGSVAKLSSAQKPGATADGQSVQLKSCL